ncbi:restriction endonuclease subunit S [Leisingera aquaemixtae]|jgi:type I restriction enzyme S subunit|uniref:restriction endonuclease subunit S n=1 Tax=Leisingera aquaemixtae TaxID=1396826 RepID=UPI001FD0D76B|nr:restriction endonuclease subunit S [Leisingera aquaemixtae]
MHRLKHFLERNDGGCWGDDPTGIDDTIVLRSTEQSANGVWRIADPAVRHVSASERKSKTIDLNDIIITKSSGSADHIGKASIADQTVAELGAVFSNFMQRIRVKRDASPRYVWHLLNSSVARYHYNVYATSTSGLGNLNGTIVGNLPFPVQDLVTQRQIADFLDRETARIDLLIEKKRRLVALLGEKAEETVRQCVSWGLDPSVSKKPSRVPAGDDLAEHWSEQPLSTICRFVQGKAHEPFIEEDGEYICVTARFVSTNGEKYRRCTKNLTPAKMNDIAMVMSDLPNGRALARAFLVDRNQLYAINQRVCVITVQEGDPRFFYYQLNRNLQLLRYNDGFNQTHLPNRAFTKLYLKVPPIDEQKRIADYLDTVSQRTTVLSRKTDISIERLKEYRSALITAAVTGQIDVQAYAKSGTVDRRLDAIQEEMEA